MKKILIIDDDAELRAHLSEILTKEGYQTSEAASGGKGIEKAVAENFDVVLLDLIMPKMSGSDVLVELRKTVPRTRIIMLTAFATVENAVDAVRKGASDYIAKPFKISELLTTIRRVLEEAKFEEGIRNLNFDQTLSSLVSPLRRTILKLLCARGQMRLMEITRELHIDDHTKVVFHLKILKESGAIAQDQGKAYGLTKEGFRIIDCLKTLEKQLSG